MAERSEEAASYRALYNKRWRRLSAAQKQREPLCRECLLDGLANDGRYKPGGEMQTEKRLRVLVADHVIPHRGDPALFYDPANLQTLCKPHHDKHKQAAEARGWSERRGADGWPVDPAHPANR